MIWIIIDFYNLLKKLRILSAQSDSKEKFITFTSIEKMKGLEYSRNEITSPIISTIS